MCAYAQAKRIFPSDEEIVTVCLETGENSAGYPYSKIKNWGILQWALPFFRQTTISAAESIDYMLRTLCINGDRYFGFQTALDKDTMQMDDASDDNIKKLESAANKLIELEDKKINRLVSLLKQNSKIYKTTDRSIPS